MSLRNILKALDILALFGVGLLLLSWEKVGLAYLPLWVSLCLLVFFGMDAWVSWKRLGVKKRSLTLPALPDSYQLSDLPTIFRDEGMGRDFQLPAQVNCRIEAGKLAKAPLSERESPAWRLEAELVGGLPLTPDDIHPVQLDHFWGGAQASDGGISLSLAEVPFLEGAEECERSMGFSALRARFPNYAKRILEALDLTDSSMAKARFLLREFRLRGVEPVCLIGQVYADAKSRLCIRGLGNSDLEGPILRPSRPGRAKGVRKARLQSAAILALGLLSLLSSVFFGSYLLAFDRRSGSMEIDADGRTLRLTRGEDIWTFFQSDRRKGVELQENDSAEKFSGEDSVVLEILEGEELEIGPDDPGYPRWDGKDWLWAFNGGDESANGSKPDSSASRLTGEVFIRNLTQVKLNFSALEAAQENFIRLDWTYSPGQHASAVKGSRPVDEYQRPLIMAGTDRFRLITDKGFARTHILADIGTWQNGGWHVDIGPEALAGEGRLYVKNESDKAIHIRIVAKDGNYLYGQNPWIFKEYNGTGSSRGLHLQYSQEDISFSGRERIRYIVIRPRVLFKGPVKKAASWKGKGWQMDFSAFRGDV